MIKVIFKYRIKTENLGELMEKFQLSASEEFKSEVSNVGIKMFKREENEDTIICLDIYYNNVDDYNIRTEFERSNEKWCDIWFNDNNKHIEESVEVFEVL